MVVAQAQKIEVAAIRVTFTFAPNQRRCATLSSRIAPGSSRPDSRWPAAAWCSWLRRRARRRSHRRIQREAAGQESVLREQALADAGVQTMLEMFPAEIRDVEEM
jgi:hypothetical protein